MTAIKFHFVGLMKDILFYLTLVRLTTKLMALCETISPNLYEWEILLIKAD